MTPELKETLKTLISKADKVLVKVPQFSEEHAIIAEFQVAATKAIEDKPQSASDVAGATREELIHTIVVLGRLSEHILEQTGQHVTQDPQKICVDSIVKKKNSELTDDGYSQPVNMNGSSIRFSVIPKMVFPEIFKNDFSDPAWHSNFMVNDHKYSGIIAMIADSDVKTHFDIPNKNIWTSPVDGRLHYIHTKGDHSGWIEALGYMPVDKECLIFRDYENMNGRYAVSKDETTQARNIAWGDIRRFKLA